MKRPLRSLVVLATVGMVACGGKGSTSDGGTAGTAGSAAGRGGGSGTAGGAGSGGAARGGAGGATGGGAGDAAGASGAAGNGDTTGTGGAAGAAGTGGNAGRGGGAGTAGASGAAGTGGDAARGGTTGTAGTGGGAGRGGTTGTAGTGAGGSAGRGGATGTAGAGGTFDGRCTAPADCSGTLPTASFCAPSWSCVEGTCAAECLGGRTCTEAPSSGCLLCRESTTTTAMSQGCVNTPCVFDGARISDVQRSSSCQPAQTPNFATWHCTGQWATLDGSRAICTIQQVRTELERWSVSCGACVSIVTIGN